MMRKILSVIIRFLVPVILIFVGFYATVFFSRNDPSLGAFMGLVALMAGIIAVAGTLSTIRKDQTISKEEYDRDARLTGGEDRVPEIVSTPVRDSKGRSVSGYCIVCEMQFRDGDDVVQCPYCANFAHRAHMIRWVRDERSCPVCEKPLDEVEVRE